MAYGNRIGHTHPTQRSCDHSGFRRSQSADRDLHGQTEGVPGTPPYAAYAVTTTFPGLYTLTVSAGSVGMEGTDYVAFAALETDRVFSITRSADLYQVGQTAVFTGTLTDLGGGIGSATVQVLLTLADGITQTLIFDHLGGGIYRGTYMVPDVPGYFQATFTAVGNENRAYVFTRQKDELIGIAPHDVQSTSAYADRAEDSNADGFKDTLVLDIGLSATAVGTHTVAADLAASVR